MKEPIKKAKDVLKKKRAEEAKQFKIRYQRSELLSNNICPDCGSNDVLTNKQDSYKKKCQRCGLIEYVDWFLFEC